MSKLDDLLDDFYSDEKFLNKKSMQSKTYTDEPILKRASAMQNYTPPKIEEMRKLAEGQGGWNWSSPKLFVRQGRLMADYEDDFSYSGTFFRYYPTYQLMSDVQLRGYFSWRTKVRRGQTEPTALSFAFVYIYELLNLIGVSSPEEGYEKLVAFRDAYAPIDGSVDRYLRDWLVDFAVYYGLDPALPRQAEALLPYRQYTVLARYRQHTPEELFDALCGLSSYNVEKSKFYKAYPEDTRAVLCRVFADFAAHHEKSCKNSLCERLFGKAHTLPYTMFSSAVVSLDRDGPDRDYEIFPWYGYSCRNGTWYRTRLDRSPAKNRKLGELVRDVDAILRERYGFDAPLKRTDRTKLFTNIVNNAVDEWQAEKKRKAAAEIRIDVSKLNAIRTDASATRDKLMTEEEREEESGERRAEFGDVARSLSSVADGSQTARRIAPSESGKRRAESGAEADRRCRCAEEGGLLTGGNKEYRDALQVADKTIRCDRFGVAIESAAGGGCAKKSETTIFPTYQEFGISPSAAQGAGDLPLDATEAAVLRAVLTGGDAAGAAKAGGKMLSVAVDAINEKLFDLFGDTVIYDAGDGPAVYEDYEEELKGRIGT